MEYPTDEEPAVSAGGTVEPADTGGEASTTSETLTGTVRVSNFGHVMDPMKPFRDALVGVDVTKAYRDALAAMDVTRRYRQLLSGVDVTKAYRDAAAAIDVTRPYRDLLTRMDVAAAYRAASTAVDVMKPYREAMTRFDATASYREALAALDLMQPYREMLAGLDRSTQLARMLQNLDVMGEFRTALQSSNVVATFVDEAEGDPLEEIINNAEIAEEFNRIISDLDLDEGLEPAITTLEARLAEVEARQSLSPRARRVLAAYAGFITIGLALYFYLAYPEVAGTAFDLATPVTLAVTVARVVARRLGGEDDDNWTG